MADAAENTKPDADDLKGDELIKKLDAQWRESKAASSSWREAAREDRAFYHGNQWTEEQKRKLEAEGRPATVINQIHKAANNLFGRERDGRFSWQAKPRGASDVQMGDGYTKTLKFVEDEGKAKYAFSEAFEDEVLGPLGWVEVGYDDSDPTEEPVFIKRIPWDEIYYDPFGRRPDLSDFRYLVRSKWVDLDQATAAYPDKKDALEAAVETQRSLADKPSFTLNDDYGNLSGASDSAFTGDADWCDAERKRIRLREHWWWVNETAEFLVWPDGRVVEFDRADPGAVLAVMQPGAVLRSGTKKCYHWAVLAGKTLLAQGESPYPYARFPFVAFWGYVTDKMEPYGMVRMMKDPQRELNVARSRFNESIRSRWGVSRQGALGKTTADQAAQMLSKSNFWLEVAQPDGVNIQSDKADGQFWLQLMETSRQEVDDVAGQNEASYGDKSNEKSGKAIQARVAQQGLNTAKLFDNYRFGRLQVGEMLLALIQKFYPKPKIARIIEAATIRDGGMDDLTWLGDALAGPIDQMKFDVVLEDKAETTTERDAAMQQAIELIGFLPDMAKAAIAPDIIRMSDFADKEAIAQKAEQAMAPPPMAVPPPGMVSPQQVPPGMDPAAAM